MSIKKTRSSNISEYSLSRKTSRDRILQDPLAVYANPTYIRNPSWPSITVNPGDNRIVALYAVLPWDGASNDGNFIALLCTGAYTVNFGDGSVPVNVASNTQVNYQYDYNNPVFNGTDAPVTITASGNLISRTNHGQQNGDRIQLYNISAGTGLTLGQLYFVVNRTENTFQLSLTSGGSPVTITSDGTATLLPYKIAIVTITPQAGQNLVSFSIQRKHNRVGWTNGVSTGWLRIDIATPTFTGFAAGTNNVTNSVRHPYFEEINFFEYGTITSFNTWFQNACANLKRVYFNPSLSLSSVTNAAAAFFGCFSLIDITFSPSLTNLTTTATMFSGCRSLVIPPEFNTAQVTVANGMFTNCLSLRYIPPYDFSLCTNLSSFATECRLLEYCSDLRTTNLLNTTSSMFANCYSLKRSPIMNTSGVTNVNAMYSACYALTEIPSYNTNLVTDFGNMFANATALEKAPRINTANGITLTSMFTGCTSLKEIPDTIQLNSATNTSSMFLNCRMLERTHVFNAPVLSNATSMFSGCASLYSFSGINTTSALTNTTSMFTSTFALRRVPLFDTSGVTNMTGMFSSSGIEEVPFFNTQNVTIFTSMFALCLNLKTVPHFNTSSATTMTNMFEGCTLLESVPLFNTVNVTTMANMFATCPKLSEVPLFNTANVTNISSMFNGCNTLREIPAFNFGAVTAANFGSAFLNCFYLQRFRATGIRFSFALQSTSLSGAALNEVYTNLPTVTGQNLSVSLTYGVDTDNPAIATAKGWNVIS